MAHEVETMFSVKQTPWHRLGNVMDEEPTGVLDALEKSGLDWRVSLQPLRLRSTDFGDLAVPARAVVRLTGDMPGMGPADPEILGVVGERYTPLQNEELMAVVQQVRDDLGGKWETAGSLRGGRYVWALLSLGTEDEIAEGDSVRNFVLVVNEHTGRMPVTVRLTPTRVVCMNTLRYSGRDAVVRLTVKHTSGVLGRTYGLTDLTARFEKLRQENVKILRQTTLVKLTEEEQERFMLDALGIDKDGKRSRVKVEVAMSCLGWERMNARGLGQSPDSAWIALNAVTHYTSHARTAVTRGDPDRRGQALVDGRLDAINLKALGQATSLVGA